MQNKNKNRIIPAIIFCGLLGLIVEYFTGERNGRHDQTKFLCDIKVADQDWCKIEFPAPQVPIKAKIEDEVFNPDKKQVVNFVSLGIAQELGVYGTSFLDKEGEVILTINGETGALEKGPAFNTDDKASQEIFDDLARAFPLWKKQLIEQKNK